MDLPQPALDLLAIGRRYFDVDIRWVPPGSPTSYGRAFGFWSVEVGPKGWRQWHTVVDPRPFAQRFVSMGQVPPCTVEWTDPTVAIRGALTQARKNWPDCVTPREDGPRDNPGTLPASGG